MTPTFLVVSAGEALSRSFEAGQTVVIADPDAVAAASAAAHLASGGHRTAVFVGDTDDPAVEEFAQELFSGGSSA